MKIIILLIPFFFCADVDQSKRDILCQKWRIDVDALLAEMPEDLKAMMDMMPPEEKKAALANMKKMGEGYVVFNKDGTMEAMENPDRAAEMGTWEFVEDGKALRSVSLKDQKEVILDIVELTKSKLKLQERNKPNNPAITFVPYE